MKKRKIITFIILILVLYLMGNTIREEASTITQENLENAKIIMDENAYEKAIIVSAPLHMKRAMLLAEVLSLHHRIIP